MVVEARISRAGAQAPAKAAVHRRRTRKDQINTRTYSTIRNMFNLQWPQPAAPAAVPEPTPPPGPIRPARFDAIELLHEWQMAREACQHDRAMVAIGKLR